MVGCAGQFYFVEIGYCNRSFCVTVMCDVNCTEKCRKCLTRSFLELNAPVKFTILLMLNTAVPVPQSTYYRTAVPVVSIWRMYPRAVVVQLYSCGIRFA
jgi:hypothetical protein